MLEKIRNDIKQDYYHQNFSNDGQRFVAWYLRNIHRRDMIQTKDEVVDRDNDKKIDAIVVDDNNSTVYIVQGKFIGVSKVDSGPLQEVLSSWIHLKDLARLQQVGNTKLKRKLAEVSKALEDDYEIVFELITTGSLTSAASDDLKTFQEQLAKDNELSASLVLVNEDELKIKYDLALEKEDPVINYELPLEKNKNYVAMDIGGTRAVIAAIPLKECIKIPGIKEGTLFQKNVRQSLGPNNKVNKKIADTIYSESNYGDFFFYHNGITAICNTMELKDNILSLKGLSVVNGCQSLNTILSCSERVKLLDDAYVLFRFYEIPQRGRADQISISTNFQSAVKPRDLRSNDKSVLNLKRVYEQRYPTGFFKTKRGEPAPATCNQDLVIDLVDLAKYFVSWHSQRPNIAYNETKLFDKYFEQLFRRGEYEPEDILALHTWMKEVNKGWVDSNPNGLNESLLAMKSYARYHQLYAISQCFAIASNQPQKVPKPSASLAKAQEGMLERICAMAAACLNAALESAVAEAQTANKVFSPQNWLKSKSCLSGIGSAIRMQLIMLPSAPGGKELKDSLVLPEKIFDERWAAD